MPPDSPRAREVIARVRSIPPGFVTTYGDLSPGAPRFAGAVLAGCADATLPWHRVVRADGSLAKGDRQRRLLEAEGTPLRGERVDMRAAWTPADETRRGEAPAAMIPRPARGRREYVMPSAAPKPRPAPRGEVMGQPVVHFEVLGKDAKKLHSYYSELFGWEIDADNPMNYGMVPRDGNTNADGVGIGGGVAAAPEGYDGHVTFYVEVPDVEAALATAESLGGSRMMGPFEVNEETVIGQFADPEGHMVGVVKAVS